MCASALYCKKLFSRCVLYRGSLRGMSSCAALDESIRSYIGPQNVPVLLDPALFESFTLANLCALLTHSFLTYKSACV